MMTQKEKEKMSAITRQGKMYKDHFEAQNLTIWTYQKFFMTFEKEMKPLIKRWQEMHGDDVYLQRSDPVADMWQERIDELQKIHKGDIKNALEEQRFSYKQKCTCNAIK